MIEGQSRNNPEARRAALQERLNSFHQAVTKDVVVDETQDAEIKFVRTLTTDQLPRVLRALLSVAGATSQNLRLEYAFAQGVNWKMPGIFFVKWDAQVENDGKAQKDQDDNIDIAGRSFEGSRSDIKSIVVYVSEGKGKDWEVEFDTNDSRSYVEFDEKINP